MLPPQARDQPAHLLLQSQERSPRISPAPHVSKEGPSGFWPHLICTTCSVLQGRFSTTTKNFALPTLSQSTRPKRSRSRAARPRLSNPRYSQRSAAPCCPPTPFLPVAADGDQYAPRLSSPRHGRAALVRRDSATAAASTGGGNVHQASSIERCKNSAPTNATRRRRACRPVPPCPHADARPEKRRESIEWQHCHRWTTLQWNATRDKNIVLRGFVRMKKNYFRTWQMCLPRSLLQPLLQSTPAPLPTNGHCVYSRHPHSTGSLTARRP